MTPTIEDRIKKMIVETLMLEDVNPADIVTDAPLFGEGLGLDSIDALELVLAIDSQFGVRVRENDEHNREHFHSVRSLAEFIRSEQAKAGSSGGTGGNSGTGGSGGTGGTGKDVGTGGTPAGS